MRRLAVALLFALLPGLSVPGQAASQETSSFLSVGESAPDIHFVGATRYGVLSDPVRLSDFRGETVVLAFFFHARTPG